jgi:hypothetical protein
MHSVASIEARLAWCRTGSVAASLLIARVLTDRERLLKGPYVSVSLEANPVMATYSR